MSDFKIYTDGAATMRKVNGEYIREAGGWAYVILNEEDKEICGGYSGNPKTTNNEMELTAIKEGLQKFDTHMIMTFLEKIVDNYMLNRVRLTDGREGEIVFINKNSLSRPIVKCGDQFVDLSKEKEISIKELI